MKKIITAINNPKLNELLKKESFAEIIGKDIQYKEGIIETLEKNKEIDIIIISQNLPGKIELKILVDEIRKINKNIKIIYILEKENEELEKNLKEININSIYNNEKINLLELIKIIKEKEIKTEEDLKKEIENLKKEIEKNKIINNKIKNENKINYKINKNKITNKKNTKKIINKKEILNKIKNNLINKKSKNKIIINIIKILKNKLTKKEKQKETKINNVINFIGEPRVGKTFIIENMAELLSEEKNKILIVDFDLEKEDISIILKNKYKEKKIKKFRINNIKIKKNNTKIKLKNKQINLNNKIKNIKLYKFIKINKNIFLINNLKKYIEKNNSKIKNNLKNNNKDNLDNLKSLNKFLIHIKKLAEFFDYILIEISPKNETLINKKLIDITENNVIIIEPDIINLKNLKLKIINNNYKFNNYKIIINKYNKKSISNNIIENIIKKIKIIGIIKYKNNKKIKNKLKSIIKKINRTE